ncbi:uncharacterized protein [Ptychodera flava]|uniref:uncharacterized protein n=1 Tax=Ptychodera flava TaxID=63121 RepID=UPI003969F2DC
MASLRRSLAIISIALVFFIVSCSAEQSITDQVQDILKQIKTNIKEGWKALTKAVQPYVDEYITPYLQGAYTFTDETCKEFFGVEASKLPRHAEKNAPEVVTAVLTVAWLLVALITVIFFSAGTSLYLMAVMFLLYGIFGAAWCLRRVIYATGFTLYLLNALANNPIVAACILVSLYILRKLLKRRSSEMGLVQLNHAIMDLHGRVVEMEGKLDAMQGSIDELKAAGSSS